MCWVEKGLGMRRQLLGYVPLLGGWGWVFGIHLVIAAGRLLLRGTCSVLARSLSSSSSCFRLTYCAGIAVALLVVLEHLALPVPP
jgi:hypothetical protein